MTKASDNVFPKLIGAEGAAPSTPAAGTAIAYVKSDGLWYSKDDAGVETLMSGGAGGGSVATDAIFDAKGDLPVGTGANTAAKLTVGTNGHVLTADSGETTGVKWAAAAGSRTWDTDTVDTQQTTSSTSYADLATAGPAVTVTVPASGVVRLAFSAEVENSGVNRTYIGFAISGATTTAAADATAAVMRHSAGDPITIGRTLLLEGLAPGSTTFTMKYRVGGGTGTYLNRQINVETLT